MKYMLVVNCRVPRTRKQFYQQIHPVELPDDVPRQHFLDRMYQSYCLGEILLFSNTNGNLSTLTSYDLTDEVGRYMTPFMLTFDEWFTGHIKCDVRHTTDEECKTLFNGSIKLIPNSVQWNYETKL